MAVVDDLIRIIGEQTVEIRLLRREVARLKKENENLAEAIRRNMGEPA